MMLLHEISFATLQITLYVSLSFHVLDKSDILWISLVLRGSVNEKVRVNGL